MSRGLHAFPPPAFLSSWNPASLTSFWLALLAAVDIISHIIFHLPPLHVPLQPLNRTIPRSSLSRTGGDNVADRRLYEAINSFYQQVDTDWKAGCPVHVKEPFLTCQTAFCLEGKAKEGLGTEAALHYCCGGFLLGQDFFKSRFQVVFFDRSGLCQCDTLPLNASTSRRPALDCSGLLALGNKGSHEQ